MQKSIFIFAIVAATITTILYSEQQAYATSLEPRETKNKIWIADDGTVYSDTCGKTLGCGGININQIVKDECESESGDDCKQAHDSDNDGAIDNTGHGRDLEGELENGNNGKDNDEDE